MADTRHGTHPKWEQELGERGSFGRTRRMTPRDDEDIWDDVGRVLAQCSDLDASDIEILVEHGVVYLEGRVGRPHEKRLAQSLAEDVPGVEDVRNRLIAREPI